MSSGEPLGPDTEDEESGALPPEDVDAGVGPWAKLLIGATLVAVVVLGIFLAVELLSDEGGGGDLVVEDAQDASVVLACQVLVVAEPGLRMPDNSLVETGPEGHFVAGGVEMGPRRQAIVVRGRLQVRPRGAELANACDT